MWIVLPLLVTLILVSSEKASGQQGYNYDSSSRPSSRTDPYGNSWQSRSPLNAKLRYPNDSRSSYARVTFPEDDEEGERDAAEEANDSRVGTKDMLDAFLTRESRNSFIARVYAILGGQLAITAASVLTFGLNPALSEWMMPPGLGIYVPALSLFLSTISVLIMKHSANARRSSPMKYQLLALFTLGEAIGVGFLSSFYHFRSVVGAMIVTALTTFSVSMFTILQKNPKHDLTQWGAALSSCGLIFVSFGMLQLLQALGIIPAAFFPFNETLYSMLGACLFSFYLAYHTKLIVSGKHSKYQMNEKDYVFGAMTLYMDIINIFIYILRIIGEDKNDKDRRKRTR